MNHDGRKSSPRWPGGQALCRPGPADIENLLVAQPGSPGDDHGHVGERRRPGIGRQAVEGPLERLERRINLPQLVQCPAQVVVPLAVIWLKLHKSGQAVGGGGVISERGVRTAQAPAGPDPSGSPSRASL